MFSSIEGVLELHDGCLLIKIRNGTKLIPVFPLESVLWENEKQALVADDADLVLGKKYKLGGGAVDGRPVDAHVPTECPDNLRYFVVGQVPLG